MKKSSVDLPVASKKMVCFVCLKTIEKDQEFDYIKVGKRGAIAAAHPACTEEVAKHG